jgi:hypothetical protein
MSVTKVSSAMQDLTDDYAFTGTISGAGAPSHRNDIINGGYLVNQENDTAAADDDYSIGDLFLHVGEAAVTTSLQTSGGPQGDRNFARINIDTANKQSGWVYFLSNADCQDYIANGKMSFGIKVKTVADKVIGTVRIGLLKWTGTADAVTSDVVGTWAQDGTNPTLATSWSYENTPADVDITTSWARYTVEDVTVDADTNNLACFVWIDDGTIAEDDQLDVSEWQLNPGSTVNAFSSPSKATVQDQVSYFFWILSGASLAASQLGITGIAVSTSNSYTSIAWTRELRTTPTVTITAASTIQIEYPNGSGIAGVVAGGSPSFDQASPFGARLTLVPGSNVLTARDPIHIRAKTTAFRLFADARF